MWAFSFILRNIRKCHNFTVTNYERLSFSKFIDDAIPDEALIFCLAF